MNNKRRSRGNSSKKSIKLNQNLVGESRSKRSKMIPQRANRIQHPKSFADILQLARTPRQLFYYLFDKKGFILGLKITGSALVGLPLLGILTFIGLFIYFQKDLPNIRNISGNNLGGSITFYDRTGKVMLWQDYNSVKRIPVSGKNISPYVKQATVAIEDKNFYHEGAFNVGSIIRAGFHDILHRGQGLQGASTITEQVVKLNEGWPDPLSITRKVKELILGAELTQHYTKQEILTAYLNIAPYGNIDYGVQAAARDYFHENASQLSLAQSAFLASIPQAPTVYSPYSSPQYNHEATVSYFNKKALLGRQQYVLDLMAQQHMITQKQADAAKKVNILSEVQPLETKYQNIKAPYFVLTARQQLINKFGPQLLKRGAWKVTTTLNLPLQKLANTVVQNNKAHLRANGGDEEALVAEQVKTGQVVSLVGGTNFNNSQYGQINYANINISPGSTIKPYVYSTFINDKKNNAGAGSVFYDIQQPLPGYPCTIKKRPLQGGNCLEDYDFRYPGPEPIRYALAGSRNVPAVKAGLSVGLPKVQSTADAMMGYPHAYLCFKPGVNVETATVNDEMPCYGSAAIGEGGYLHLDQTVNGLATLGRLGQEIPQAYILKIENSSGHTIYQWKQPQPKQVIHEDTAYIIDNILSDPRATYLPGRCTATTCTPLSQGGYKWQHYNGWKIAIKTGTTHNDISGLMTAWTTQYAVATWAGYHTVNKPLRAGAMEYLTEPLARGWMQGALNMLHTKPVNWKQPPNIKVEPAFVVHNHVGVGSEEPSPKTDVYPWWYKPPSINGGSVTIDKVSGKLATTCTPADAKKVLTNSNASIFSVDKFVPASKTSNINGTDNIHNCNDSPPTVTLTPPPGDTCSPSENNGRGCLITAMVKQGTYPLSSSKYPGTLVFTVNGKKMQSYNVSNSPSTVSFYYAPSSTGTIKVTATATDSVLYQDSQSITLSYANSTTSGAPSQPNSQTTTNSNTTKSIVKLFKL